ncbi:MAG: formamidopyrimidine-DNA glycosylase [Planctomycetes bacterium]|nr:formamidopyrimidine-DNA glycosylase [Planctomycetota bacterium]
MPELPDVIAYVEALRPRVVGQPLVRASIISPFLLRTFEPPIEELESSRVERVSRIGKRIVLSLERDLHAVVHLMIAGRFRWLPPDARLPGKIAQAAFDFPTGRLVLTEAAQKKRASLHLCRGQAALHEFEPGGLDLLNADHSAFHAALGRENHTLKRTLTDPTLIDGVGNAYSDEILHAARLSPVKLSQSLTPEESERLLAAARRTLDHWIARLRADFAGRFPGPGEITAFRPDFAVHGKYGKPCPVCGSPVQRIRFSENETNYCATCQAGGRVLADRSLSRLLREDWPRTIDSLESGSNQQKRTRRR